MSNDERGSHVDSLMEWFSHHTWYNVSPVSSAGFSPMIIFTYSCLSFWMEGGNGEVGDV